MSKPRTPGSIIAASVIMFIYGGLLIFCGVCAGASAAFQANDDALAMQAEIEKEAPALSAVTIVTNGGYLLLGLLFSASGVGVLRLVKFFRTTAYLSCAGIILLTVASGVYSAVYILPIQQRLIMQEFEKQKNPPMPPAMNMIMTSAMAFGLLVSIGSPLVFCVPTVILLNVKSARDAFAGTLPEPVEDDPYAIRRLPRRDDDDQDGYGGDTARPPQSADDTGITDKGE